MELIYDKNLNIWIYKRNYKVTKVKPIKLRGDE